jgi:hypothetical protein
MILDWKTTQEYREISKNFTKPVAVVVCFGKYRTGKSTLLNYILKFQGF